MTEIEPNEAEMLASREVIDHLCPEFECECGPENPGTPFPCPRCGTQRAVTRIIARAVRPRWASEKPTPGWWWRIHKVTSKRDFWNADPIHLTAKDIELYGAMLLDFFWAECPQPLPLEPEDGE